MGQEQLEIEMGLVATEPEELEPPAVSDKVVLVLEHMGLALQEQDNDWVVLELGQVATDQVVVPQGLAAMELVERVKG